jgi:flagellin-like protein
VIDLKGITPVIAIILLLLITISMVGFAFVWFQRVQSSMTNATETELQSQLSRQSQKIAIDNAAGTTLVMRNIGTSAVPVTSITAYVNNAVVTLSGAACTGNIAPGATVTCTISSACNAGASIKVTSPGGQDIDVC